MKQTLQSKIMDVVLINRYYGWYNLSGDLEAAKFAFRKELDWWEEQHKPVILSEYGADTIAGLHGAVAEKTAGLFVRLAPGEDPDFPDGHDDKTISTRTARTGSAPWPWRA
ncbi:MAG: hypothetical protein K6E17_01575 [Clostridiales bacterium]|nr:hypothetical protein [Clostridiales bacterium]